MKRRFVAILCTLTAAACGSSDHPAQDPSTASATQTTPAIGNANGSSTTWAKPSTDTTPRTDRSAAYAAGTEAAKGDAGMASPPFSSDVSPGAASSQGTADSTRNADNTAMNERDRHGTLTPMDQGGKDSERQMTAAIRRGVMGDKSLSFAAKNVKIITVGSKVTLRGTVKTDEEKASIEAHARQAAGVTDVDNQIDVKAK